MTTARSGPYHRRRRERLRSHLAVRLASFYLPALAAFAVAQELAREKPLVDGSITAMVSPVPARLNLDGFYKKHVDALGIPVVSSEKPPDIALLMARDIVIYMLAKRPELREALIAKNWRVGVMAQTEMTTDIPEHRDRKKPPPGDAGSGRARSSGS